MNHLRHLAVFATALAVSATALAVSACGILAVAKGSTHQGPGTAYVLTRDNGRPDSLWIEVLEVGDGLAGRLMARIPSGRARVALGHIRRSGAELTATVQLPNRMTRLQVRESPGNIEALLMAPDDTFRFVGTRIVLSQAVTDLLRTALDLRPFAMGVISTDMTGESFTALSPDATEIVFTRHEPDWSRHVLMTSRFTAGVWTMPVALPISGQFNDREPFLAPNGLSLWFSSNRPIPLDSTQIPTQQIWFSTRETQHSDWQPPKPTGPPVNVGASDMSPSLTRDGTLYFTSRREGAIGRNDIVRAVPDPNGRYRLPVNLGPSINSATGEPNVYVSPDGTLMLYVAGDRPNGLGLDDIYISRLVDGEWTVGRLLGPPVSSYEADYGPSLSADGKYLYFTSHRRGTGDLYRIETSRIPGFAFAESK